MKRHWRSWLATFAGFAVGTATFWTSSFGYGAGTAESVYSTAAGVILGFALLLLGIGKRRVETAAAARESERVK